MGRRVERSRKREGGERGEQRVCEEVVIPWRLVFFFFFFSTSCVFDIICIFFLSFFLLYGF